MSTRLLTISLFLNLLLVGVAGYQFGRIDSGRRSSQKANPRLETQMSDAVPAGPTDAVTTSPLKWSEIESQDYAIYIANLRKAGCPEPVLRRIIHAELTELYAKKSFALTREFHSDFWKIAARSNIWEHFERTYRQKIKALAEEPHILLNQLLGEAPRKLSSLRHSKAVVRLLTDFLSPEKQERLKELTESYETRFDAVRQATDYSSEERITELAKLRQEMEREKAKVLSPEELAEYRLRQSSAASEVQQLYGVDFNETELRLIAKAIDDYHRESSNGAETDSNPETLDQKLQALLGATRFNDLKRARSASYRELYEFASDFGLPPSTAAEIFDLRINSENQSDAIRADKNQPFHEKQEMLDALQQNVDQTVLTKMGIQTYQIYKIKHGGWINSMGRF